MDAPYVVNDSLKEAVIYLAYHSNHVGSAVWWRDVKELGGICVYNFNVELFHLRAMKYVKVSVYNLVLV